MFSQFLEGSKESVVTEKNMEKILFSVFLEDIHSFDLSCSHEIVVQREARAVETLAAFSYHTSICQIQPQLPMLEAFSGEEDAAVRPSHKQSECTDSLIFVLSCPILFFSYVRSELCYF